MASAHRQLFEVLGSWIADELDPDRQRHFAIACHRHAWHAELWTERTPSIPVEPLRVDPALPPPPSEPATRLDWYLSRLDELVERTSQVAAEIDPALDPSTARVTRLVLADLAELAHPTRPD